MIDEFSKVFGLKEVTFVNQSLEHFLPLAITLLKNESVQVTSIYWEKCSTPGAMFVDRTH